MFQRFLVRVLALAITLVGLVATRDARGEDFTGPAVGTRFAISSGGHYDVVRIEGRSVITENNSGKEARWLGGFMRDGQKFSDSDRAKIEALWPLAVGKSVSFDSSGATRQGSHVTANNQIRVLETEQIEIRSGKFETFKIEWRERGIGMLGSGSASASFIHTYWYAPKVGFVVKYEYREDGPAIPNRNQPWEVKSISHPKAKKTS